MTTVTETQDQALLRRLAQLGVSSRLVEAIDGPQVTTFVIEPIDSRIKMMDFTRLSRASDLAFALGVESVKIQAPLPGRQAVAIEVAKDERRVVTLDDIGPLDSSDCYPLRVPIGLTTENELLWLPLGDGPHMSLAGQTGSGKTKMLHTMIAQLCRVNSPQELNLVLIDPKRTELTQWEDDAHLAASVAETPQEAIRQLQGLVNCMEERYEWLRKNGARDVHDLNRRLRAAGYHGWPRVVCVVDEFAELMTTSRKEAEGLAVRLAQKGRAAGIHLVIATQYPLREILTGTLRVNTPLKIGMRVADKTASRLVLDRNGAEQLLGRGDGLMSHGGVVQRFQAALVSDDEVDEIKRRWR